MVSTDSAPQRVQVDIPADVLAHIAQVVAASRAEGGTLTLDQVVEAALRDWLADLGPDLSVVEKAETDLQPAISWEPIEPESARARALAALDMRRAEGPAQWAARADRLDQLFAAWEAADATLDPAQAEAEWQAFQAGMNANRAATGERLPYP